MVELIKKGLVHTTHQTLYSQGKLRNKSRIELANKVLPIIKKHLKYSNEITIVVGYIKAKRTHGDYNHEYRKVRVDPRTKTKVAFIDTLCHELVHANQYHTGMLRQNYDKKQGWIHTWKDGDPLKTPTTHKKYLNLPWEIDARQRAKELVEIIKSSGVLDECGSI